MRYYVKVISNVIRSFNFEFNLVVCNLRVCCEKLFWRFVIKRLMICDNYMKNIEDKLIVVNLRWFKL